MEAIMFETFSVFPLYIQDQASLSLCGSGRTTSVVIDCGYDNTSIVPVFEGYCLPYAVGDLSVGCRHLTNYMEEIIEHITEDCWHPYIDNESACKIKEKLCYIALDVDKEAEKYEWSLESRCSSELPNGEVLFVDNNIFFCTEQLFIYYYDGKEKVTIPKMIYLCFMKCPEEIDKDLFKNIVLCGGSSMFHDFFKIVWIKN